MNKLINCFNWFVFIVFITALCSLDGATWTPVIVTVITGAYLVLLGEIKGIFTAGVQNVHRR